MAESAKSSGLDYFSIQIQNDKIIDNLDLEKLSTQLNQWATISTRKEGSSLLIDIQLTHKTSLATLEAQEIPVLYRPFFHHASSKFHFEEPLTKKSSLIFVDSTLEGVSLQAHIDPQTHFIQEVSFSGSTTEASRKLMTVLCSLLIHKPANECHDHAIICLEYELRDKSQKRINPGITTPFNTWEVFKQLTALVRNLIESYQKKTGFQERTNFYFPRMSREWSEASESEKRARLECAITEFCRLHQLDSESIFVKEIQHQTKVVLNVGPDLCRHESVMLMEIEVFLRKAVEKTLSLYNEEEPDLNQMRWDRPAVKSQAPVFKIVKLKEGVI